jgi:serine/threonine protein kinase
MGIGPPGRCRSRTPWVWGCNWPTASTPHSAGILHRDINPANIFITDRGTAKLLDFGLARAQGAELDDAPTMDVTAAGTVMGTVAYMSPEQARGEQLDARSDLFSLGVVLYEMLTGRPAFTGNTSAVIFERIFNETLEPPPAAQSRRSARAGQGRAWAAGEVAGSAHVERKRRQGVVRPGPPRFGIAGRGSGE